MRVRGAPRETYLLANAGKTTSLTALVHRCSDPVNLGVTADLKRTPSVPPFAHTEHA